MMNSAYSSWATEWYMAKCFGRCYVTLMKPMLILEDIFLCGPVQQNKHSTAIHVYQPVTNSWSNVGTLPTARSEQNH